MANPIRRCAHPRLAFLTLAALTWLMPSDRLVAQVAFGPNLGTDTWLRTEPSSTPSQTLHLDLQAAPGRVVLVGVSSTGAAAQTPWGKLWLGPWPAIPWGMYTDNAGRGQATVLLPPTPGIEAYLQAVVLEPPNSLAFSNLVRVRTGGAPLVWHEDFESYGAATYPSGWSTAVGNTQQFVDNTVAGQGQQSFQLVGMAGSCWSAGSVRRVDPFNGLYPTDFTVEVLVRNSNFAQTGCHGWYRAAVLFNGPGASERWLFITRPDGTVKCESVSGPQIPLLQWHRVRVRYTRMDAANVRLICHVDGTHVATVIDPIKPNEDTFNQINIRSAEGPVWFDDIRIWSGFGG